MPGYINGVIEKKREYMDEWNFVSRLEPFVGAQGNFKYLAFGMKHLKYFDPFPYAAGFPEDISNKSKMNFSLIESDDLFPKESLDDCFERYAEDVKRKRVVKLADLGNINWDEGISDSSLEELRNRSENIHFKHYRVFKLTDSEGRDYRSWPDSDYWWYRDEDIDDNRISSLIKGQEIELREKSVSLEKRTRRDLLPEEWFKLLDLLNNFPKKDQEVRFILCWIH